MCGAIGLLGVCVIIFLIVFHCRRQKALRQQRLEAQYSVQKSNNENEENIRRYKNPLFSRTDKGGGTVKSRSTEMCDLDMDNKNPSRFLRAQDSPNIDSNDWKNTSPKQKTKTKDINIELSKSRSLAARAAAERAEIQRTFGIELSSSDNEVMV